MLKVTANALRQQVMNREARRFVFFLYNYSKINKILNIFFMINWRIFLGLSEKSKMSWKSSHKIQKKSKNFWRAVGCNWQKNSVSFFGELGYTLLFWRKFINSAQLCSTKIGSNLLMSLIWDVLFCVLWKSYVQEVKNLYGV